MPPELTADTVRVWVSETDGVFCYKDIRDDLIVKSGTGRANLRQIMRRLVEEGLVERITGKDGFFRRILAETEEIENFDFLKFEKILLQMY